MLNFLKKNIPQEDQYFFDISFAPFFWYSIITAILIIFCESGLSQTFNKDVSLGLFISWIIFVANYVFAITIKGGIQISD